MPWILLFLPLIVAVANQLVFKKTGLPPWLSLGSAAATFCIALALLGAEGESAFPWATIGNFSVEIGVKLDRLATGMMIVVTGVGLLVHLFSLAYMKEDEAKNRYFTGLSLFMFSMTGIVLASNFLMMFMCWELVGLSSYLLIGHWFQRPAAADAAKKAFLVNRIGDFGFLIGILTLWGITGTFAFDAMQPGLAAFQAAHPEAFSHALNVAVLCIFCGAIGKSAQLPLHVWLPDAMEGPTPVSALIHAATMVAAGVYMLFRLQISLGFDAFEGLAASTVIAWVGGITSLAAALMATQQDDIKRILAYSTLSQLGYMVMAVGLLSGEAGMFHLFTHAWFKALLFLGAGAVIHACHHEQDIWKMGGLLRKMPVTGVTFALGTAALIAVPYVTSGFWSKEEILSAAYAGDKRLFVIAAFVALLTAFYMTRLFVVAFLGKPRSENAGHAHEVGPLMSLPLAVLALMAIASAWLTGPLQAYRPVHADGDMPGHIAVLATSIATLLLGLLAGLWLYRGRASDPLDIPLLRHRFYIDDFYRSLVRYGQDAWASLVAFFDALLIDGFAVSGTGRIAEGTGNLFRKIQSGSLQGYAFAFGLGVLLVIYLTAYF